MIDFLRESWHIFAIVASVLAALAAIAAASHAVLNKSDSRAALGWVGVICLVPLLGPALYVLLGINRIERRAVRLRARQVEPHAPGLPDALDGICEGASCEPLLPLVELVHRVTGRRLVGGNSIVPLENGDEAFPAMLAAIDRAKTSITMCTYIFDDDAAGKLFAVALQQAVERGVEVRVLVDDVGSRYSWPSGVRLLSRAGVNVAKFLPALTPGRLRYSNLRNHRKLLVVDGAVGFTGGMNIREGNFLKAPHRSPIRDLHFRIEGPVVHQLQEIFALDWSFTTGELLEGASWYAPLTSQGEVACRSISDGPDEDLHRLERVIHGAVTCATSRISILTPYFLPDRSLIDALSTAAMRGVNVDIILPSESNLRLVQWASTTVLPELLDRGCRVWLSPPPFDHSKLLIVDGIWSMIGSANWDPRSLRLNFELDVECYSADLAARLSAIVDSRLKVSAPLTAQQIRSRPILTRLRDGIVRLAAPYL